MENSTKRKLSKIVVTLKSFKKKHEEASDPFYSCELTEEWQIVTDREGTHCTCGADIFNKKLKSVIGKIERIIKSNSKE